jgi:hypothetical protein
MESHDDITALNLLFIETLKRLGEAGETDAACRLAAQGWSLLRHDRPKEAQRLNGVLHYLTHPARLEKRKDR